MVHYFSYIIIIPLHTECVGGYRNAVRVCVRVFVHLLSVVLINKMKTASAITKFSVLILHYSLYSLVWDYISCMAGDPVTKWQLVIITIL